MNFRRLLPPAAAVVLLLTPFAARADEGPSLTVYSSADPAGFDPQQFISQQRQGYNPNYASQVPGFGVVKEIRSLDLAAGMNELKFTDVAEFIDPTTVSFTDLTAPGGTMVLEQAFQFDLASPSKILERYIDKDIGYEFLRMEGAETGQRAIRVEGRVLSVNQGQVVLQTKDGLRFIGSSDPGLRLPALPQGLITKPTLVWKVQSDTAGKHEVRTTYQTSGITWRADYNVVLSADDTKADVGAWVTLLNLSGAGYANARLKLIAGDVQRIQPKGDVRYRGAPAASKSLDGGAAGFEEKSFFEYHLYTLPRRTDVAENTTQQITLFPTARDVNVEKVLVYYGAPGFASWSYGPTPQMDRDIRVQGNKKVDVYVRFKNEAPNHMGMPLPKGKVRVYKADASDGTLEFIGEDLIDHTPKDEVALVKLGQSFDVVGERTQTKFTIDQERKVLTETYRITLKNHKDAAAKVLVKENLFRWSNWEMVETTDPFVKIDSRTIHFEVDVPANGEKSIAYTVRYSW